jgi:predicted ester cyclase
MSDTPVRDLIAAVYRAINDRDLDRLDDLFAESYVDHQENQLGVQALKDQLGSFYAAFPDLHVTLEEVLADGERYASRTTVTGTQTGSLMGVPPTGRTINVTAVDIGLVRDGKATERWGGLDTFALLNQLGVIPTPQPT